MGEGAWLVAFLIAQRLVELGFAQFNTGRLRANGGVEFGAAHYPLMIVAARHRGCSACGRLATIGPSLSFGWPFS